MEHSRLLKYLQPGRDIDEMEEPVKVKFDYKNPENVEAEVPGSQNIREAQNVENDSTQNGEPDPNDIPEKDDSVPDRAEDGSVTTRHRPVFSGKRNGIHGEPVLLTDKQKEKRSKTKIPVSRFKQTVERVKAERRGSKEKKEHESHIPVRRSSIPKPAKDPKSPTTTVQKEITITKTEIRKDSEPTIIRTKIKKQVSEAEDEFDKMFADIIDNPPEVIDDNLLNTNVEDPEKLETKFEEIIHNYDEHKVEDVEVVKRSKIPYLKRRSQQDMDLSAQADRTSKIIAARDKLRLRHSLTKAEEFENALDEELNKDQSKNNMTDTKTEKEIKLKVITSPNSNTEITSQVIKTVSTSSCTKNENNASSSVVETTIVEETTANKSKVKKENKEYNMTEENIIKGSIQIKTPVFNSYVHEFTEKNESEKTIEVKSVLSHTSRNSEFEVSHDNAEIKNESDKRITTAENYLERQTSTTNDVKTKTRYIEKTEKSDISINSYEETNIPKEIPQNTNETNVEEEVHLRSKVGKVSNVDSKELVETETNKRESINELTKKKSVLSKIALFEQTAEQTTITATKKNTKLPKLITNNKQTVGNDHIHTPLIVDEVFKPFQANIYINEVNKEENTAKANEISIVKSEHTPVISDAKTSVVENKIQIDTNTSVQENKIEVVIPHAKTDSEYAVQKIEITNVDSSKDLTLANSPSAAKIKFKYEMNNPIKITKDDSIKEIMNNDCKSPKLSTTKELQAPLIIPGFKPVSELLRSFEAKKTNISLTKRTVSKEYPIVKEISPVKHTLTTEASVKKPEFIQSHEIIASVSDISYTDNINESYDDFDTANEYKSLDDVFSRETDYSRLKSRQEEDARRAKSLAELDIGDAVKGKVNMMILRMKSVDRVLNRKEVIDKKEMPRKKSVSEKIALFEGKLTPTRSDSPLPLRIFKSEKIETCITPETITDRSRMETHIIAETKAERDDITKTERTRATVTEKIETDITITGKSESVAEKTESEKSEEVEKKIEELNNAKAKYGTVEKMPAIELSNGVLMPEISVGTALVDLRLLPHVVTAAIDLGYRGFDTAYIYGNENAVGEAIRAKIADGTVTREDLFITSKLWSTYHRPDLVEAACRASLDAMGLEYFDLYLIHNPMSFKEGGSPMPKIATVLQYSEHDYLDAWYGMETLVAKGLVRSIGVSNFNSVQLQRVLDKGKIKPVVNQVECHPYLSQQRLEQFCSDRNVTLMCFGVLGSKGTPQELKAGVPAVIDDALVQVMASGLGVTPAQLLISYQLENGHGVVVKSSTAAHLRDNLQALDVHLTSGQVDALHALNRNKRMFTYKGMGDTHKNYPFNIAF